MIGSSTVDFVDLDDAPPPNPAIGNFTVSINTTAQLSWSTTGPDTTVFNRIGANSGGTHTYILADTSVTPAPSATLVEHFHVKFLPPAVTGTITAMAANLTTPSLPGAGLAVTGNFSGISGVNINGSNVPFGTGTISYLWTPNTTIAYSVSSTDVDLVISTTMSLPYASTNPVPGTLWRVTTGGGVGVSSNSNSSYTDMTTVTTHYDAHFA